MSTVSWFLQQYVFSSAALWWIFLITGILVGIFSAILVYHWQQYIVKQKLIWVVSVSYFSGIVVILGTALISLLSFHL